jgi:hypothetical protein
LEIISDAESKALTVQTFANFAGIAASPCHTAKDPCLVNLLSFEHLQQEGSMVKQIEDISCSFRVTRRKSQAAPSLLVIKLPSLKRVSLRAFSGILLVVQNDRFAFLCTEGNM